MSPLDTRRSRRDTPLAVGAFIIKCQAVRRPSADVKQLFIKPLDTAVKMVASLITCDMIFPAVKRKIARLYAVSHPTYCAAGKCSACNAFFNTIEAEGNIHTADLYKLNCRTEIGYSDGEVLVFKGVDIVILTPVCIIKKFSFHTNL